MSARRRSRRPGAGPELFATCHPGAAAGEGGAGATIVGRGGRCQPDRRRTLIAAPYRPGDGRQTPLANVNVVLGPHGRGYWRRARRSPVQRETLRRTARRAEPYGSVACQSRPGADGGDWTRCGARSVAAQTPIGRKIRTEPEAQTVP